MVNNIETKHYTHTQKKRKKWYENKLCTYLIPFIIMHAIINEDLRTYLIPFIIMHAIFNEDLY